jgi:hypothetical protein
MKGLYRHRGSEVIFAIVSGGMGRKMREGGQVVEADYIRSEQNIIEFARILNAIYDRKTETSALLLLIIPFPA